MFQNIVLQKYIKSKNQHFHWKYDFFLSENDTRIQDFIKKSAIECLPHLI